MRLPVITALIFALLGTEPAFAYNSFLGVKFCCMQPRHGHGRYLHRSYRPSAASSTNPKPSPSAAR